MPKIKESREILTDLSDMQACIRKTLTRPVVLVGMMGAGKSHIGRELSDALGLKFFDSDKLIEEKAGRSVAEIFENFGEKKFRSAEHNTIIELLESGPCIIATGGGALTNPRTLQTLERESLMVWLDADLETLWQRVQKSQTRPLLYTENPKDRLDELTQARQPLYEHARIHFKVSAQTQQKACELLIKALYEYLNKDSV